MPRLTVCIGTVFLFSLVSAAAQQKCEHLRNLVLPGVTVTIATAVPAGPFAIPPPQARTASTMPATTPTATDRTAAPATPASEVPAFCRIAGVIAPEISFELWLPAKWNHKLLAVGNGGLAGSISYAAMMRPLQLGYATSSTDTGHAGSTNDGAWALHHYERIVNFADRAVHMLAETDKSVIKSFYGADPSHSYFSGCSQGGHEAMIEAQRYPADFDGIIAGDPANNWTRHYVGGHLWVARAVDGDGYLPPVKVALLAHAVNDACDALDGVKDGVLNDPRRCHFDPSVLLCKGGDQPTCLTAAQAEAVHKIYNGVRTADGDQIYPGLMPGGEDGPGGWSFWITGAEQGRGGHSNLGLPFFKYMVFDDASWDFRTFRFEASPGRDSDVDYTDAKLGALFNAVDPDLTAFKARGGKLLQYHGWSDPDITPLNSINYYESVVTRMAHNGNHGMRDTRDFYRLFLIPGMQHCNGGPGATPSPTALIEALDQWADHGVAPDRILATHLTAGKPDRTRPLCPYPQEAHYSGSGDTSDARNFVCALPAQP